MIAHITADSKCLHDTNEMKSFWRAGAPIIWRSGLPVSALGYIRPRFLSTRRCGILYQHPSVLVARKWDLVFTCVPRLWEITEFRAAESADHDVQRSMYPMKLVWNVLAHILSHDFAVFYSTQDRLAHNAAHQSQVVLLMTKRPLVKFTEQLRWLRCPIRRTLR